MNASEGNEPRKASSPLPFREAINNFVRNLSVTGILNTDLPRINETKKGVVNPNQTGVATLEQTESKGMIAPKLYLSIMKKARRTFTREFKLNTAGPR
ncbi:hypothetical protein [Sunxiuqinia rutila]|uniref:hypothetical protein n=1 Tax=Sunxiuqinia rutila TaxID=1397841 RepID=UPI003D36A8A1